MAEHSGFFDAHLVDGVYDRVYLAESFAKYFASFIANGVFGGKSNELMVKQKSTADMSVRVLSGQGWINGYWYENDDELSLSIDVADGVLNRIDLIVLRWNNLERVVRLAVKKGTPATNALAPAIQRDDDYYELKLAEIYVKAGTTRIMQVDITDTRLREDVCGFVVGVVQQLDTEEFGIQLGEYVENFIAEYNILKTETYSDIETWKTQTKSSYNMWFNQFKIDSNSSVNTLLTESQAKVDKLVSDGQKDIGTVVSSGQQSITNVVNNGQTSIDNVVVAGQQNIAKVVSDGTTNINKVVTNGQTSIGSVVSKGTTDINALITSKTAEIDNLISENEAKFNESMAELEDIKDDNDLTALYGRVTKVEKSVKDLEEASQSFSELFVESGPHPGCYYRIVNNENEWINPPNEVGIAYRTTERWNNKPVYQRNYFIATLPNKTTMGITTEMEWSKIISVEGFAFSDDDSYFYPFPIIINGLTPAAVITRIEGDGGTGTTIAIQTNEDLTYLRGYIRVKYTKE